MVLLDTNAVLRYLLQDNEEQADAVNRMLTAETCLVTLEVTVEIVYVLHKVYKIDRRTIAEAFEKLMEIEVGLIEKQEVTLHAIRIFADTRLDMIDCVLVAYAKIEGYSVLTFDKALKRQLM